MYELHSAKLRLAKCQQDAWTLFAEMSRLCKYLGMEVLWTRDLVSGHSSATTSSWLSRYLGKVAGRL